MDECQRPAVPLRHLARRVNGETKLCEIQRLRNGIFKRADSITKEGARETITLSGQKNLRGRVWAAFGATSSSRPTPYIKADPAVLAWQLSNGIKAIALGPDVESRGGFDLDRRSQAPTTR